MLRVWEEAGVPFALVVARVKAVAWKDAGRQRREGAVNLRRAHAQRD
jgi:hypothetical protein